jgi:adenine-specific DNA-methyltransferase
MPFLDWVNKAQAVRVAAGVPYHLLNFESAHGDTAAENLLIQGDNLLALKALLPFYRGRVKCIFIDPPYNTQSAFEHYDDKLEHSQWLSMMHPRLVLLRELLAEDGSIWVTIDDNEAHYLKVLMDEVFGRTNFVSTVIWQKLHARNNSAQHLSADHDFVLVYAKSLPNWKRNKVARTEASDADFWNPDDDLRGLWRRSDLTAAKPYADGHYEVVGPHGDRFVPRSNRSWSISRATFDELVADDRIWWGKTGGTFPFRKRFKSELGELVPTTVWVNEEVGNNREAKQEVTKIFGRDDIFSTPKPERLLERVLVIATKPGDLVLDSFLGSATTSAVAHKMGRRYIGIELGDHARTHCLPRLQKVIDGEQGGISGAVGWQGGGGFRFYTLGEPVFDADGGINPAVTFGALAGYLWHFETGEPATGAFASPLLGIHGDTAIFLLYNGILGDRKPQGGNVLTSAVLAYLDQLLTDATPAGQPRPTRKVVYGEITRLSDWRLDEARISFRQIPYDIKAR